VGLSVVPKRLPRKSPEIVATVILQAKFRNCCQTKRLSTEVIIFKQQFNLNDGLNTVDDKMNNDDDGDDERFKH